MPPLFPATNCSHSVFEHKHSPVAAAAQLTSLSLCVPASVWLQTHTLAPSHIQMARMPLLPLISLEAASRTLSIFSGKLLWRFGREWQDFPVSKETVPFPPLVIEECWRSIPVYVSVGFFVSFPWYEKQKCPNIEEVRSSLWLMLDFLTSLKSSPSAASCFYGHTWHDLQTCWRRPVLKTVTLTIPFRYSTQTSKKTPMWRPLAWRSVCCLCSCTFSIERQIDF